jgi:hypothetical protein
MTMEPALSQEPAMPRKSAGLLVIQLNEVNFDLVEKYLAKYELPGFRRLMSEFTRVETFAEQDYDELEPWIQWVSAHSGKQFCEHRVFRLGDGAHSDIPQVFELLEQQGLKVGAISPMNARNELQRPCYFIPDPWTDTKSDVSGFSQRLTAMLQQTVNENAQGKISVASVLTLVEAVVRSFDVAGTGRLLKLIAKTKKRRWYKALILDHLIHLVHLHLLRKTRPDVSFLLLNAGAHIQHHYYFNSPFAGTDNRNPAWYVSMVVDPVLDMLKVYDRMLLDYLAMHDKGCRLMVATGLTQTPYGHVKFYYRLKNHTQFLSAVGICHARVLPRMTRDFEVSFTDKALAQDAVRILRSVRLERDGRKIFSEIEDRGLRLFVTLTYPSEVLASDCVVFDGGRMECFLDQIAFVAIKNGMHSTKGFAFFSPGAITTTPSIPVHVASLFKFTLEAAGVLSNP